MNILMAAINDPAGTAIQFCKALNQYTDHSARLVTLETRYTHSWEKDLHVPDLDQAGMDELGDVFSSADVLHFHMTSDEDTRFGPYLPRDFMQGKMIVHHHHGHHDFRSNPESFRAKYNERNRKALLVSTPDLLKLLPEADWLPNMVPVDEPLFMPASDRAACPPLRVAHSPTRKDLKNTDDLLAVVRDWDGPALELDLIDDVPNSECLARKKKCHVLFDHMQGYYGVSSLEGLSQGLAVIAGLDDWNRGNIVRFAGTEDLPWVTAHDREELRKVLGELAADPERTAEIGKASRKFMEEHWSDRKVAGVLAGFYARWC